MSQHNKKINIKTTATFLLIAATLLTVGGCGEYTQGMPYPDKVQSVYVEMFGSRSLRRGAEYTLTDAVCKQIEVQTPYKIISDRSRADSVVYGEIVSLNDSILATEPRLGTAIEKEARLEVVFSWKDLNSGKMYVEQKTIRASADYTAGQDFGYGTDIAVNKAARAIVESMRIGW